MRQALLTAAAVTLLAGCATPPAPSWESDVDAAQINAIERAAAHTGVKIYWINAPRKPVKKDG